MPITDTRRKRQAAEYGQRLRRALDETGTSVYRLARVVNPQAPESARSNIQRYLAGKNLPGAAIRSELAQALDRPELQYEPDDSEARRDMDPFVDAVNRLREAAADAGRAAALAALAERGVAA